MKTMKDQNKKLNKYRPLVIFSIKGKTSLDISIQQDDW